MALSNFRSVHLPYCLQRLADGRYVVLNREHKPIGFKTKKWVEYDEYPIAVRFKGLTAKIAAELSADASKNRENIFLYNDGCIPTASAKKMKDYLERLAVLAKLKLA